MAPPLSTNRIGGSLAKAFNLPPSSRVTDIVEAMERARNTIGVGPDPQAGVAEIHEEGLPH
jgi:hypothetical protein